jgi:predicted lipoprotein with Yx(FWY)xxD motif
MRTTRWLVPAVALLAAALALGAIACKEDKKDNGGAPTATAANGGEKTATPAAGQTPSASADTVVVTGGVLTDADGMTLYTFDNDGPGVSNCGADCTSTWPPLTVDGEPTAGDGVTGTLGTIVRDDGSTQVTLDGQPLYHYAGDSAPGDKNGDGIGGIWHIVSAGT